MISNYDKQVDIGRKIFLNYDQEALIQKYTLDADADFLYLTYLGTKCRVNRKTGAIDEMIDDIYTECREYTVVMTIYDMLCHGDSPTLPPLWEMDTGWQFCGSRFQPRCQSLCSEICRCIFRKDRCAERCLHSHWRRDS